MAFLALLAQEYINSTETISLMFSNKITDNSVATPRANSRYAPVQEGLEKFSKLTLAVSISVLLGACGSDGDDGILNATDSLDEDGNVIIVPQMGITVEKSSLEAGGSTDISVRFTDQNNDLITETIAFSLSSDCLSENLSTVDGETSTTDGTARIEYTANGCSGEDTVTVSSAINGLSLTRSTLLTIAPGVVTGISASVPEPTRLSLKGVGGEEMSTVTFTVLGDNGSPIIGEEVVMTIRPTTGRVSFSNSELITETTAVTGIDGTTTIKVYSGTANTIFRVLAEHAATGNSTESANISVSTGVPVQSKFVVALDRFNPPSARRQGQEVAVSVIASDQYGNPAADGTIVNFLSPELGQIDPSCALENGRCSVTWVSSGAVPGDGDYRSAIIAYTDGAEDFTDRNGNNVYDGSDTFDVTNDDLSEPYADENENDQYDDIEFFRDFNRNGARDEGDGVWNGPCLSSVDQSALCEGDERVTIADTHTIVNSSDVPQIFDVGNFGSPGSTITLGSTSSTLTLRISDINGVAPRGNTMPVGTTYKFASDNGTIVSGDSYTVQNNEQDGQLLALVIKGDGTSNTGGDLTLTVKAPEGAEKVWNWTLND